MAIRIVQSKQNARVKELRAVLLRPARSAKNETSSRLIGIEGIHLIEEAVRSQLEIQTIFVAIGQEYLLDRLSLASSVEILAMPRQILDSAVSTESPQPVAALALLPSWVWEDFRPFSGPIVILAGIQDPGNLGTILRSAEAFGATGVVCLEGTVNPWNSKAMRASAGSIFRLPLIESSTNECFNFLLRNGIRSFAAMAHEAEPLSESSLTGPNQIEPSQTGPSQTGPIALVIGSEGSGIPPEIAARCDARITIPCPGPVESLNAAVAASILLYEASRQRSKIRKAMR